MSDAQFMLNFINDWYDDGDGRFYMNENGKNIIVSALEKQIPKKIEIRYQGYLRVKACPSCGQDSHEMRFCGFCGQAFDWSDMK